MHAVTANKPAISVPWDCPQAKRVYDRLDEDIDALEVDTELWSRTGEIALRLATIRAIGVSSTSPRITVEDMEWGRDLASWSARRMAADAADYMSENDYQRDALSLLKIVRDRPGISVHQLQGRIKYKMKARDRDAILKDLIDCGDVTEMAGERADSGGHRARLLFPVTHSRPPAGDQAGP